MNIHFSSAKDDWNTPSELLALVRRIAPIGLDPCSNTGSVVNAQVAFDLSRGEDGLAQSWEGYGLVFCNPPYGRQGLKLWAKKISAEAKRGVEIVALVPARPGKGWWGTLCRVADKRCLLTSRLTFLSEKKPAPAPFPNAVFYFGPNKERFARIFREVGEVSFVPVALSKSNTVTVTSCAVCQAKIKAKRSTRQTCSPRCRKIVQRRRFVSRAEVPAVITGQEALL